MSNSFNYDDMRPYYDNEVNEVLQRVIADPLFMKLVNNIWPEMTLKEVKRKAELINSVKEFQMEFMHPAARVIINRSSELLTGSGFENLDKNQAYLFIANHRDIMLDSGILNMLLVENGFDSSEITIGDNLMTNQFISDFVRINKILTVSREGTGRELYDISRKLSAYIRYTITEKNVSVWIAQRNGRTKDGNDLTQTGLLKMLNISGTGTFAEKFSQLKIVPVSISYEYEPCDLLKVQESFLSDLNAQYVKAPGEDLNSIITGIMQPKGRIHLAIGKPIVNELQNFENISNENDKIKALTALVDKQIYADYKLWSVNYVAADMVTNSTTHSHQYTIQDKENFIKYINSQVNKINGDKETLFNLFVAMYANPVKNKVLEVSKVE